MVLSLTLWAFKCKGLTFSLGLAMHSDNQVDFPQFAPEQRQMLFSRQAQAAVCHQHLPLTSCYAGRITQMFLNCRMEKTKGQKEVEDTNRKLRAFRCQLAHVERKHFAN